MISAQVKGGKSYRRGSKYYIPYSPADQNLWVDSSVPVYGIVHDDEGSSLHWVNLTSELLDRPADKHGTVEAPFVLDDDTWSDFYRDAVRAAKLGGRSILGLHSDNSEQQHAAISDCFALGRFDSRAFIMLRRSLLYLSSDTIEHMIYALSHCISLHPDRWWTKDNMVSDKVRGDVLKALNWAPSDAAYLLKVVDSEDMFSRGTIGQDIYLLLSSGWDPDVRMLFEDTLDSALKNKDMDVAFKALIIIQYQSDDDAPEVFFEIAKRHPALLRDENICNLFLMVQKYGWLDIS